MSYLEPKVRTLQKVFLFVLLMKNYPQIKALDITLAKLKKFFLTAQTAQISKFMFCNVVYRITVYKTVMCMDDSFQTSTFKYDHNSDTGFFV